MKSIYQLSIATLLVAFIYTCGYSQKHKYVHNSNGDKITVDYEGKITLADNDKSIAAISDFGYFRFKKNSHEIYIKAEAGGKLTYTYYVRGKKKSYEPEGRTWFENELPQLIRESGFAAESRVARFYKQGGTSAVLDEIKQLEKDYAQYKYFKYLLRNHPVKNTELTNVVNLIGTEIKSDYYKGKILRNNHQKFLQNAKTTSSYVKAVANINSDYEKSKALRKALQQHLPDQLMAKVIDASIGINSDYEKSKVLRSITSKRPLSKKALDKVLVSTISINSDYEKSKVLRSILVSNSLNDQQMVNVINTVKKINSDYEKSKILRKALVKSPLSEFQLKTILDVTMGINSNHEKAKVLVNVGKKMPANNAVLKKQFTKVAKTISSDHEYGKVMRSLNK